MYIDSEKFFHAYLLLGTGQQALEINSNTTYNCVVWKMTPDPVPVVGNSAQKRRQPYPCDVLY